MTRRPLLSLLACLLVALIALTGMASAAMMAPSRDTASLEAFSLAHGPLDHGTLCGEMAKHEMNCPLCHGLPEAPSFGFAGRSFALVVHDGWRAGEDLHRAAQARVHAHGPRGPPRRA